MRYLAIVLCFGIVEGVLAQYTFNNQFLVDGYGGVCCSVTPIEDGYLCTGVLGTPWGGSFSAILNSQGSIIEGQAFTGDSAAYSMWNTPNFVSNDVLASSGFTFDNAGLMMSTLQFIDLQGDSLDTKFYYSPFAFNEPTDVWDDPSWFKVTDQVVDDDDNIYQVAVIDNPYCVLRKLDSQGELIWSNIRAIPEGNGISYTCLERLGDVLYYCQSWTEQFQAFQTVIYKTHIDGTELDSINIGTAHLRARDLSVLSNGDFLLAARDQGTDEGDINASSVVRFNQEGEIVWEFTIGQPSSGERSMREILELEDGNFVVCGETYLYPEDLEDGVISNTRASLIKFNEDGDIIWHRDYIGENIEQDDHLIEDMKLCPDGGFVFCGRTNNPQVAPTQRPWVVKTDDYGCVQPGCHLIDGVEEYSWNGEEFLSVFPNPASRSVTLSLDSSSIDASKAAIHVHTIGGTLIDTLDGFSPVSSQINLDLYSYSPGIYQVSLVVSGRLYDVDRLVVEY